MDYESILYAAKKNDVEKKEPVRWLQTKFKPPTKQQREKDKVLAQGVQKFLARKEEEDKKKKIEAERRKAELLALRAKDPKALKRIQTMLKRTKSANKSVMEDAVDNDNTADTLSGPLQPDDDDYGFVSESASEGYQKLMQKLYSSQSEDQPNFAPSKKPKGGNLMSTKERVKMALLKEKEDELLPRKRKRKEKDKKDGDDDDDDVQLDYSAPDRDFRNERDKVPTKEEKPKFKKPAPPPMDFNELMKIAQKKQFEPVVVEQKRTQEPEMLMTKKQRADYLKLQEYRKRRKDRENGIITSEVSEEKKIPKIPKLVSSEPAKKPDVPRIPKVNKEPEMKQPEPTVRFKKPESRERLEDKDKRMLDKHKEKKVVRDDEDLELEMLKRERDEAKKMLLEKERIIKERDDARRKLMEKEKLLKEKEDALKRQKEKEKLIRERDEAMKKLKMFEEQEAKSKVPEKSKQPVNKLKKPVVESVKKVSSDKPPEKTILKDVKNGVRQFPPKDLQNGVRQFPPKDLQPKNSVREFPPKDLMNRPGGSRDLQRSKQFPPADVRRKPPVMKKRNVIEDSDEYDSDLADFIDDGPEDLGQEDVSNVISQIFHYDRRKYSRYDDDDECMESNYAQISKEEYISTREGLMEDLEDIRREKEELARKKKMIRMRNSRN